MVLLAVPGTPEPARASATPSVTAQSSPGSAGEWIEQQPTDAEIAQQQARVARLAAQERERSGAVLTRQAALRAAAAEAGMALEVYTRAVRGLRVAQDEERRQQDLLAAAQGAVAAHRGDLGRWARAAYQGGGPLSANVTLTALLQVQTGADVATTMRVLRGIGTARNHALEAVDAARRQQAAATEAAAGASAAAEQAAVDAATARRSADQALAAQRLALGQAETALDGTRDELTRAQRRRLELQAAAILGTGSGSGPGSNRVTGAVGECAGGADVQQYANGRIPLEALCPLRTDPRHHLRADAAFALDRLTVAYAQRFGTPLCVTDSYRSLAAQIDVFARKPDLAAVPGTSNHGWGTAVDLCGGVQEFSSAQHHWMQFNAQLFGWFHPAWAQPGGSRPEPWHWEFAG
jgi:hypothetical protein